MARIAETFHTQGRRDERGSDAPADPLDIRKVGDFQFDMVRRTAMLNGRELGLDPAEFDLLLFLIEHPKQLVTPQTVLATRWPGRGPRQSQFVRVLMSLRGKLEAGGSGKQYIRTEPWIFYRFDPHSL